MVNSELLNQIADQIETHPESFNMSTWANVDEDCGTQYCVSGWAIVKSASRLHPYGGEGMEAWLAKHLPESYNFERFGRELLGIDSKTSRILFFNTEDCYTVDFPTLLRELAKGKPIMDFVVERFHEDYKED